MALHSTPTILERALQALQEYERTHSQAGPSAVLPFDQPPLVEKPPSGVFPIIEPPLEAPNVCRLHGAEAYWWHRQDGGAVCGLCHPDPFALAAREAAQDCGLRSCGHQVAGPPSMPAGVRLLAWEPKQPPVALSVFSVVNDTQKFILSTLQQLEAALRGNPWAAGNWTVRDLCERLEQVGVRIEVVEKTDRGEAVNMSAGDGR